MRMPLSAPGAPGRCRVHRIADVLSTDERGTVVYGSRGS